MLFKRWFHERWRLPLLFLAVTAIPAVALGWLTIQLVEKDRRLETQQVQERVERAADRIVAASHQKLAELEHQLQHLTAAPGSLSSHLLLATVEGDRVTVTPPGALVFHPVLPKSEPLPRNLFAEGERYEHQEGDPRKAIEWFQARTRAENPAVRAGALLRLGRNQQKAGLTDAALATYAELRTLGAAHVETLPAALLSLAARGSIFEKTGRHAEMKAAGNDLRAALANGSWPLLQDVYDFYGTEARRWTGDAAGESESERSARAAAS